MPAALVARIPLRLIKAPSSPTTILRTRKNGKERKETFLTWLADPLCLRDFDEHVTW